MRSVKELRSEANKEIRKNGLLSFFIYFIFGLIAGAICLIGIFFPLLLIVLTPILILPLYFATDTLVLTLQEVPYINLKNFFQSFGAFFIERFRSTYAFWKSLLKSFIVMFGFAIIYMMIINIIVFVNDEAIRVMVVEFQNLMMEPEEAALQAFMDKWDYQLNYLAILNNVPCYGVFTLAFAFFTSYHSLSYFFRFEEKNTATGAGSAYIHKVVVSKNRKYLFKSLFGLNWYIYLFFLLSLIGGAFIGDIVKFDANYITAFSNAVAVFATTAIFGPIMFANKVAIYNELKDQYFIEMNQLTKTTVDDLVKELEKLNQMREEGTKKDSDESE